MIEAIQVGQAIIEPGERRRVQIPISRLPSESLMSLSVEVIHGVRRGPRLWLSAAVHGDEVNGIEIIRQVLRRLDAAELAGSVLAIPIVNGFGFLNQSRYLPDRRDLNRSFPGSARGSMAARVANLFMREIVQRCSHGIDLHTGSHHRTNLPQIRVNLQDAAAIRLAALFGAPVILDARTRDGSLRQAAGHCGVPVLVYEAGEPLRFDRAAIRLGVHGVLRVMAALGMRRQVPRRAAMRPLVVTRSSWVRAKRSGILRLDVALGEAVRKKQRLGAISDPFGDNSRIVASPYDGVLIAHTNNPLVHQGDGLAHLAREYT